MSRTNRIPSAYFHEIHKQCRESIQCSSETFPTVYLRVRHSANNWRRVHERRLLCPGGPEGIVASAQELYDYCWFSAAEVMAFCEKELQNREKRKVFSNDASFRR